MTFKKPKHFKPSRFHSRNLNQNSTSRYIRGNDTVFSLSNQLARLKDHLKSKLLYYLVETDVQQY